MFKQKKDYIKKKYKDVPPLNIGDVNRILQQFQQEDHKFRMFTSMLEIQKEFYTRTQESNTEEILRKNVQRLIELYGDADINQDALNNMYKDVNEEGNIEEQICSMEYSNIFMGDTEQQQISIERKIDKYDHYLNVLQTKLSKSIFSNYSVYLQALQNIDSLGKTSEDLILKVREGRQKIQLAQSTVLIKGKQITEKRQQISNLQLTLETLIKVKNIYANLYEMFVESMQSGWVEAEKFLPILINMQTIEGLSFIPKNYKEDRIEYVRQLTSKGLIDQFISFEEKIYTIHYESYKFMEKTNIVQPYNQIFDLLVMRAFEAKLLVVLDQISSILGIEFYFDNLTDSLNQISKDQLPEFYRELCCQSFYFLMNFHLVTRYHLNNAQEFQIIEFRKLIYEKIMDRICEIIEQTTSWPRLIKEEMICFFGTLTIFIAKSEAFGGQDLTKFKEFIEKKFDSFITSRGFDKQLKEDITNDDCKKCLKVTLNQTQMILALAARQNKFNIFSYKDPFPETLNVFKSIEFKKVVELILGSNVTTKKKNNNLTLIYQGRERNILLTYTANQLYYIIQQYLFYINFCSQYNDMLCYELQFLINYYIYTMSVHMLTDDQKKYIFEDTIVLAFDQKNEAEQYTQQFEHCSEVYIYREKYGNLIKFLKNIQIPKELKITKTQQFELIDRVVFIESIIFLINEFQEVQEILKQFQPYYEELQSIIGQLQQLILRSYVDHELFSQLASCKYEIKPSDKEDQVRSQLIEKIVSTNEVKLSGLSTQQLCEVKRIIYDEVIYLLVVVYSRVRKFTGLGCQAMLSDYQKVSKLLEVENQEYEIYVKTLNQTSSETLLEFIENYWKIFPFKVLLGLFNAQGLQSLKKQQKKEQIFKIFQKYSL